MSKYVTLLGSQFAVGLSAIIGVTVTPGQAGLILKQTSGGTLFAGVTAGGGWGQGYVPDVGETINVSQAGTFYLAAAGATCVVHMLKGNSSGF